jgi:hypothetical protein
MIIITSKKDGFRRCGVAHPAGPTEYQDGTFSPDQIKELQSEPMLMVVEEAPSEAELSGKTPSASDTIALVKAAATIEELGKLAEGEKRKTVLDAIAARQKELEA